MGYNVNGKLSPPVAGPGDQGCSDSPGRLQRALIKGIQPPVQVGLVARLRLIR
jgi:hypothetical protein